jgi:hypothetical protein
MAAPASWRDRDIFERLYATRLDRLRELDECRELLTDLDKHGLLTGSQTEELASTADIDDDDAGRTRRGADQR